MIEDIEDRVGVGRTWNYKPQHDKTFENLSSRMSYLPFLCVCVFPQEVHLGQDFRILRDILLSNFWICQSRKTWRALHTLHVVFTSVQWTEQIMYLEISVCHEQRIGKLKMRE